MSTDDDNSLTLVVTAHPDPGSLTHHVRNGSSRPSVPGGRGGGSAPRTVRPQVHAGGPPGLSQTAATLPDVVREHRRLDRATDLVLVFPVYWWSMPALLKGWIDRVFVNGWAFDVSAESGVRPRLQRLTTHLLPVAGADSGTYER
ncbi:NAD(P)H-dependent oxidoreductase, partial [Streptomyces sp. MNU103]|uniref:NAD(P)H-dependent oxidoreductase n=1 Tax=Streptomyces sp. MNU103 TaxID=2560024 RepID=UPI001E388DBD|nr:NAD(P)H-dependent oxidoreductase [Streptomyces sp. MNU103]